MGTYFSTDSPKTPLDHIITTVADDIVLVSKDSPKTHIAHIITNVGGGFVFILVKPTLQNT
jgi:hypothetical protein